MNLKELVGYEWKSHQIVRNAIKDDYEKNKFTTKWMVGATLKQYLRNGALDVKIEYTDTGNPRLFYRVPPLKADRKDIYTEIDKLDGDLCRIIFNITKPNISMCSNRHDTDRHYQRIINMKDGDLLTLLVNRRT